jgi:hypothetical protein
LALRVATERQEDRSGRPDVRWQTVILDLPDDGGGALPLLRGVILRQEKSATYKLALLRCIARIADVSPNVAREAGDFVELPLGLIALYWLRMYKPLVERGIPQGSGTGMGFVKDAFHALAPLAPFELRPGASFTGATALAVRQALADAARLITLMPTTHLSFADNSPVFPTTYGRPSRTGTAMIAGEELLWTYGTTRVPLNVWNAMRRMSAWIEPMLVAEWLRLTQVFAEGKGRVVSTDEVLGALRWMEPERDTALVRSMAMDRLSNGRPVSCVWSGQRLGPKSLDIDHLLPWSAWPCGDLWNLLPTASQLNRHGKRERLVTADALVGARPRIQQWWQEAYLDGSPAIRARFAEEARTTLPIAHDHSPDLDELFAALDFRRMRLRQETQAPEWNGIG